MSPVPERNPAHGRLFRRRARVTLGTIRGSGELPLGALSGEACKSSSDHRALVSLVSLRPAQACPSPQEPKGAPDFMPTAFLLPWDLLHRTEYFSEIHLGTSCFSGRFCSHLALPAAGAKVRGEDLIAKRSGQEARATGKKEQRLDLSP